MKSVELAAQLGCDDTNAFIFTPYHGTPMRDMCIDAGFIDKDLIVEMRSDDQGSFLDPPSTIGVGRGITLLDLLLVIFALPLLSTSSILKIAFIGI